MAFTTGNLALAAGGLFLSVSVLGSVPKYLQSYYIDNETPLVQTYSAEVIQGEAAPGGVLVIDYEYFRRPGCEGTVEYRLNGTPEAKGFNHPASFPIENWKAGWPDGKGMQTVRARIPRDFWPGEYEFVFITTAERCKETDSSKASSEPIQSRSIPVKVTVRG